MERLLEINEQITLNAQTVKQLLEQAEIMSKQPGLGKDGFMAFNNLATALNVVLPYVPTLPQPHPDEVSLENDIRQEIQIAGANENG